MRALVLALTLASAAHAGKLEEIRARGRLIVSVKNDAARPHKDPAHLQKRAFELELVHALAARLVGDASKVELKLLPRPVRLTMLDAGVVDLVVSMIPVNAFSTSRSALSHPYFISALALLSKKEAALTDGAVVAALKQGFNDQGADLAKYAAAHGLSVTTRYYPSFDEAAQAVTRGEVTAMAADSTELSFYMKQHPGFRMLVLEKREHVVAVKKGEPELLAAVNAVIDELAKTGELRRMCERHQLPYRP